MSLPTFLGIGVPRAGTTWLHHLLAAHPDVYMPAKRKEIHFFDRHYDRDYTWYRRFFPSPSEAARYKALGEITPAYMYCAESPRRIRDAGIGKLIVILRDPVERARSHFGLSVRNGRFSGTFEEFTADRSSAAIRRGYYSVGLRRYLELFRRDELLVLVYEEAVSDPQTTSRLLGEFIGVDARRFPETMNGRVNASYRPRLRTTFGVAHRLGKQLRLRDQDWIVNLAKRLGVPRLFGNAGRPPSVRPETRKRLQLLYHDEIGRLEELLGRRLDIWRQV